jgi:hypothetical protein
MVFLRVSERLAFAEGLEWRKKMSLTVLAGLWTGMATPQFSLWI